MKKRYGAMLVALAAACQGPVTENDLPGKYCTSTASLPVSCVTLRAGGESTYEERGQTGSQSPTVTSGHWAYRKDNDSSLVVLGQFPLHPDRGEAGRGMQILRAETTRNEVRLYADYDIGAYYLKQHH